MTKRIARLALAAAAVSAFVLPAAPASACSWTFVEDCVHYYADQLVPVVEPVCWDSHTFQVCVP